MKAGFFSVLLCVLLILITVCAGGTALYFSKAVPGFNAAADSVIARFRPAPEPEPEPELLAPISLDGMRLASYVPLFSEKTGPVSGYSTADSVSSARADRAGLDFSFSADGYSVTCSGQLARLADGYDGVDSSVSSWTFVSDYPIVCGPMVYADSAVFADAAPSVFAVDITDGRLLFAVESPVYPAAFFTQEDDGFVLSGRDGNMYRFVFVPEGDDAVVEKRVEPAYRDAEFAKRLRPDGQAWEQMLTKIHYWLPGSPGDRAEPVSDGDMTGDFFAASTVPMALSQAKPASVFLFYPEKPATYTIGITDAEGRFLTRRAFSAVFTASGQLLAVSLDYVADDPVVTLPLEADVPYYIVMGMLTREEGTENLYATIMEGKGL